MTLAGVADYLFLWQLPLFVLYLGAWLVGGTYLTRWALGRMTELPRRRRTLGQSLRLNFFTAGSGLLSLAAVAGAFGILAGRAESHKVTIAVIGIVLGLPAMFATAWAVGLVMLDLPAGTWLRITAVTTGALLAVLVLLIGGAFPPARSQHLTNLHQARCEMNLEALRAVLNKHSLIGQEAESIEELVAKGRCGPELLRCPAKPAKPRGYLYVPCRETPSHAGQSDRIRVCDRRGNHGSSRMVLYVDSRIEPVSKGRFAELLKLPENAKMAELVRAEE